MVNGFQAAFTLAGSLAALAYGLAGSAIAANALAGVFLISGVLKLRRPKLAAEAIVNFGVTQRVRPMLGRGLGAAEISLAVALAVAPFLGSAVATVLLWCFSLLIARGLRQGRAFACFCFGDDNTKISHWTLMRTVLLGLVATGLLLHRPSSSVLLSRDSLLQWCIAVAVLAIVSLAALLRPLVRLNAGAFSASQAEITA